MKSLFRTLLLLGLLALLLASTVHAVVDDHDEDADDVVAEVYDDAAGGEARHAYITRAIFPNSTSTGLLAKLPAGAPATSLIAYQNNGIGSAHQVVLVAGYLQPVSDFGTILQNFSVVRQARTVKASETATFQYTFTPDASFEPGQYNLVVGLFYADTATNQTDFATAFNATVYIDETLGTDPRTVLTYLTLVTIASAVGYYFADRFGLIKMLQAAQRSSSHKAARPQQRVEVGTRGEGYNPDYVSPEHLRYREDLLRRSSASPTNRHSSASPNKKKR